MTLVIMGGIVTGVDGGRLVPRVRAPVGVATGHDVDVSDVGGEGRGGGDGDRWRRGDEWYRGHGDEEVALHVLDLGAGEVMVEDDALDIAEDEERGVVDDKVSLTKGKQDHKERFPRLLACYKNSPWRESPGA